MKSTPPSTRAKVHRLAQRAHYDRTTIEGIIDAALVCHIAFQHDGSTHCLPTSCWRDGDFLYIHGANNSRMAQALLSEECCLCITHLDGLVLARSAFHHSMNYRSVVIYGRFGEIDDHIAKQKALANFIEHVSPGRSTLVRPPSPAELSGTRVLRISLLEASAKIREGGVKDAEEDLAQPVWAGVIPLSLNAGKAEIDPACADHPPPARPVFVNP